MTGLTPVLRVFCHSCTAPAIEPWALRLTAGISSSAARLTRSGIRHAPSRIEYSEWTWRWTNSDGGIAEGSVYAGPRRAPSSPFRRSFWRSEELLLRHAEGGRPVHLVLRLRPGGARCLRADADRRVRRGPAEGHLHRRLHVVRVLVELRRRRDRGQPDRDAHLPRWTLAAGPADGRRRRARPPGDVDRSPAVGAAGRPLWAVRGAARERGAAAAGHAPRAPVRARGQAARPCALGASLGGDRGRAEGFRADARQATPDRVVARLADRGRKRPRRLDSASGERGRGRRAAPSRRPDGAHRAR